MVAGVRPILPKIMRGAKEPVLMKREQRDRRLTPRDDGWPADERDIMEMHDVERAGKDLTLCARL